MAAAPLLRDQSWLGLVLHGTQAVLLLEELPRPQSWAVGKQKLWLFGLLGPVGSAVLGSV